jgi:hypothetical protein
MNEHFLSLMDSLPEKLRDEAENLLLETICRFEPAYVGPWEEQDVEVAQTIKAVKGLLRVSRRGYVMPTTVDVVPFIKEYFAQKGRPWDVEGHDLLAGDCLEQIQLAQDEPERWKMLMSGNGDKNLRPLDYAVRYWMFHVRVWMHHVRTRSGSSLCAEDEHAVAVFNALGTPSSFENWRKAAYSPRLRTPKSLVSRFRQAITPQETTTTTAAASSTFVTRYDPPPDTLLELLLATKNVLLANKLLLVEPRPTWWQLLPQPPNGQAADSLTKERLYYAVARSNDFCLYTALRRRIGPPAVRPRRFGALARATWEGAHTVMTALLEDGVERDWPESRTESERGGDGEGGVGGGAGGGVPEFWPNYTFVGSRWKMTAVRPRAPDEDSSDEDENLVEMEDEDDEDPRDAWRKRTPLTPLAAAIVRDDAQALIILKRHGLELDWEKRLDRATRAARSHRGPKQTSNIARYLIDVCVKEVWTNDPKIRAHKLFGVLRNSVLNKAEDLVREALSNGADPNHEPKDKDGRLVSTPLNDAVRYMQSGIQGREYQDDISMRQLVDEYGTIVRCLIEAGAKLDIYTRAFIKDYRHLQIIFEGYGRGDGWEKILDIIDQEFLDDTWVIVKKKTVKMMERENVEY